MNIWRIPLTPGDPDSVNLFEFCYQNNILYICWGRQNQPGNPNPDCSGFHKKGHTSIMTNEGDFVWTRNRDGDRLYLGKIEGCWEGRISKEKHLSDIFSICPCEFHEVRPADFGENRTEFFSRINNPFASETVQQIITDEKLKQCTIEIWEKIQSEI